MAQIPQFRPMTHGDIDSIMAIETRCHPHPWTKGIFADCLRVGYEGWLMLQERDQLLGYGMLSIAAGESHLLNITIAPDHQGQGLGRALLGFLVNRAQRGGADMLLLEVRPSNRTAISLYESFGFNEIGRRPDYYPAAQGREDAVLYALQLDDRPEAAP